MRLRRKVPTHIFPFFTHGNLVHGETVTHRKPSKTKNYTQTFVPTGWQQNARSASQHYFAHLIFKKNVISLCSQVFAYKPCTKHFPLPLCITKVARSTSQNYILVPHNLHEAVPGLLGNYYKPCLKHSQYHFVLQTSHEVVSSTTLCCRPISPANTLSEPCFKIGL